MQKQKIVVLTGAGISADSGLETFRDANGLWAGHRVEDVATPQAFIKNPQRVLDFYNARRRQLKQVEPNAAHYALAKLAQQYSVQIITQNVDNLHERAGSPVVLHLHGELTKACSSVDPNYVIDWEGDQTIDDTDTQGYPMRPFIVWFGEPVPLIDQAIHWVGQADKVIVIGTSMQVYPAASLLQFASSHAELFLVDPNPPTGLRNIHVIAERAKDGVPKLVEQLLHMQ